MMTKHENQIIVTISAIASVEYSLSLSLYKIELVDASAVPLYCIPIANFMFVVVLYVFFAFINTI